MGNSAILKPTFNNAAAVLPRTSFADYLEKKFGRETAHDVLNKFVQMGLPVPADRGEFIAGTEGALVFLNKYGVVIRIEYKNTKNSPSGWRSDRVNNSPWILLPLATIAATKAVIEICPGCHTVSDNVTSAHLKKQLKKQRIRLWDPGIRNMGRIPIKSCQFPNGIPVVIDRLAVISLSNSVAAIKRSLGNGQSAKKARAAAALQKELYGPLQQSFSDAWPDTQKMKQFWALCQLYTKRGSLVKGWNEAGAKNSDDGKSKITSKKASTYGLRLRPITQPSTGQSAATSPYRRNLYQDMREGVFYEDGYRSFFDNAWLHLWPTGNRPYHDSGWKFRLSVHPDDVEKAWNITVDTLVMDKKVMHCAKVAQPKIIKAFTNPAHTQAGKMITIYTKEGASALHYMRVMRTLEEKLRAARIRKGPQVMGDRKVPGAKFLSYRNDTTPNGQYNRAINNVRLPEQQRYNPFDYPDPYARFVIKPTASPKRSHSL